MSDNAMLEEMLKINADSLGTLGRDRYEEVRDSLYPRMCEKLFNTSQENVNVANYESAISNLEQVMQMDAGYQDGQAMLLLAQAYEGNGDQDQANTWYQKILEVIQIPKLPHRPRRRWTRRIREAVIPKAQRPNGDGDSEDNASGSTDSEEN